MGHAADLDRGRRDVPHLPRGPRRGADPCGARAPRAARTYRADASQRQHHLITVLTESVTLQAVVGLPRARRPRRAQKRDCVAASERPLRCRLPGPALAFRPVDPGKHASGEYVLSPGVEAHASVSATAQTATRGDDALPDVRALTCARTPAATGQAATPRELGRGRAPIARHRSSETHRRAPRGRYRAGHPLSGPSGGNEPCCADAQAKEPIFGRPPWSWQARARSVRAQLVAQEQRA